MLLSAQTVLGYGQESSWGSPVAATDFFPSQQVVAGNQVKYRSVHADTRVTATLLSVPTFAGGQVQATHFASKATILDEMRAMLGTESVNGNKHTFSVAEMPPSYTITEYDGAYARAYVGGRLEGWVLNFSPYDGLKTTSTWWSKMAQSTSWSGASVTIEEPPMVSGGGFSIGGNHLYTVEYGQMSFQRALKMIHNDGSQDVAAIHAGAFIATCDLVLSVEDDALWDDMANGTQSDVSMTFDWFSIDMYTGSFTEVQMDRSDDLLRQHVHFRAVYSNSADAMISATVTV